MRPIADSVIAICNTFSQSSNCATALRTHVHAFTRSTVIFCSRCCCCRTLHTWSSKGLFHKRYTYGLSNGLRKLVCMFSGSLNGHLRTNFFQNGYAHAACIRSKPSRRRSSWSKPHLFGCPVCGVIRIDFQHPNRGNGPSVRAAEKLFVRSVFKWDWVKFFLLCCKRHGNCNGHLRAIAFETATPMPYASGRSPRGGSLPLDPSLAPSLPPSLPVSLAPCRQLPHPCFL